VGLGIRRRVMAATYDRLGRSAEPKLEQYRERTAGRATGKVLELGGGTGANLSFYNPEVELIVAEPNPHMASRLHQKAADLGREVTIVPDGGESLPFSDNSFDSVVSTLVMCSVKDLGVTLQEARRVLKAGGTFYFFEHVLASGGIRRTYQNWLNPPWRLLNGDCNINRDIPAAIQAAGFTRVELESFDLPIGPPVVRPTIVGAARV